MIRSSVQCRVCRRWFRQQGLANHEAIHRPLVCACVDPEPEWVYVAHQCKRCLRVIPTGGEPFSVAESGSREAPDPSSVRHRPRSGVASSATEPEVGHGGWRVPAADAPPAPEPSATTAGRGLRGPTLEVGA